VNRCVKWPTAFQSCRSEWPSDGFVNASSVSPNALCQKLILIRHSFLGRDDAHPRYSPTMPVHEININKLQCSYFSLAHRGNAGKLYLLVGREDEILEIE